ncbi:MAG: PilZ domain-containing protein [Desulfobacterales bacterium]|nr:PilZ domain-containing protein [Desulfobacterales bacterium]
MNEVGVGERLIGLIKEMSEDQKIHLLNYIESQQAGYRQYSRKAESIPSAFVVGDQIFTDFIKNISAGGVFITSKKPQSVGNEVSLNFMLGGRKRAIRVFGKIIRSDANGFAVEFCQESKQVLRYLNRINNGI